MLFKTFLKRVQAEVLVAPFWACSGRKDYVSIWTVLQMKWRARFVGQIPHAGIQVTVMVCHFFWGRIIPVAEKSQDPNIKRSSPGVLRRQIS